MKIAIDIDEVIVEHLQHFLSFYNALHGTRFTTCDFWSYAWHRVLGITEAEEDEIFIASIRAGVYDLEHVAAVAGAFAGVAELSARHELCLLSARCPALFDNARALAARLGVSQLLLCQGNGTVRSKRDLCLENDIGLLIEDNAELAADVAAAGIQLVLLDKPWNRAAPLRGRAADWSEVLQRIVVLERDR